MEFHLKFIGILLIFLAFIHVFFPKYFNWREELSSLSLINKQMMQVHTFFISLILILMAILCIISASELIATRLGKRISFGFGLFWAIRLYCQFFIYAPELWKGKKFETTMHITFSILWMYLTSIFFSIYFFC